MKTDKGLSHIGLATRDLEGTRAFYEGVLGFPVVALDTIDVEEGGQVRHIMFNIGRDQLLAFMAPTEVPGLSADFDTSLYGAAGVPSGFYHIAFEAATVAGLEERRKLLISKGYTTSPISIHDWAASFYFKDPVNGLALEFCCWTREWTEKDALQGHRFSQSLKDFEADAYDGVEEARVIGAPTPELANS
jgi:catechol 2,3-dioxygenase-like lactoylglutathione lyase family enzyme